MAFDDGEGRKAVPVEFNFTLRDAVQSNMSTKPSAEEIVASSRHAQKVGWSSIQITGGTFLDLPAKHGRDEWAYNRHLCEGLGGPAPLTALVRGDCVFSYTRQPQDVIEATLEELAKMGVRRLSNFHGLNDTRMQAGVVQATLRLQDKGHDIHAQGGICVEDNPNITLDSCYRAAEALIAMGSRDLYIKLANGISRPDFNFDLVTGLKERFDERIYFHAHNTYGLAYPIYLAAIEAGVDGVDVLTPALAEGTAQPSALRLIDLMRHHPNPEVRTRVPKLNLTAMEADERMSWRLRSLYGREELRYNPKLLAAMFDAHVPGGAASVIRNVPQLEANVGGVLGTKDWDEIQRAIYRMQAKILGDLGNPVQVTPYAKNTTIEAAFAILREARGKAPLSDLTGDSVSYLIGNLGRVPEGVKQEVRVLALQKAGLTGDVPFISADQKTGLPAARETLIEAGFADPTLQDVISVASLEKGPLSVVTRLKGENTPIMSPGWPNYFMEPELGPRHQRGDVTFKDQRDVAQALGGQWAFAKVVWATLELQKHHDGFYDQKFLGEELAAEFQSAAHGRAGAADFKAAHARWIEYEQAVIAEFTENALQRLYDAGFRGSQIYAAVDIADAIMRKECAARGITKTDLFPKINRSVKIQGPHATIRHIDHEQPEVEGDLPGADFALAQ